MDGYTFTIVALIGIALLFDFLNGLHDAANSIATVVSTRVLTPRLAVLWAAFFNFIAFLVFQTAVANTVGKTVDPDVVSEAVIFAGLVGAIAWNFLTWWLGLPTSSSHALIGGFAGAGVAKGGIEGIPVQVVKPYTFMNRSGMILSGLVGRDGFDLVAMRPADAILSLSVVNGEVVQAAVLDGSAVDDCGVAHRDVVAQRAGEAGIGVQDDVVLQVSPLAHADRGAVPAGGHAVEGGGLRTHGHVPGEGGGGGQEDGLVDGRRGAVDRDQAIGAGPYMLGERFSACDLYLLMLSTWQDSAPGLYDRCPNVKACVDRAIARPAVIDMMRKNGMAA